MSTGLEAVPCNVCHQSGGLHHKKVFRFSTPIVIIGWLFLIPSLLGVGCGACGLATTGSATSQTSASLETEYRDRLAEVRGLSPAKIEEIVALPTVDEASLKGLGLTDAQAREVDLAHSSKLAGGAGAAIGGGLMAGGSIFVIVSSFIGGLLGWILILRKKVIACRLCSGVHSEAV